MELNRAIKILEERIKIDRDLRGNKESDYDKFVDEQIKATETVLKELNKCMN